MKVFSVCGISKSGKTTTIEAIIRELCRRGYRVGTIKEIHFQEFAIDKEGTNTYRHRKAGASLVTARGLNETDILYQQALPIQDILKHYDQDVVILEGNDEFSCPKIITAHSIEEIDERLDRNTFAISGIIAAKLLESGICEYKGIQLFDGTKAPAELTDLILNRCSNVLPISHLNNG